MIILRRYLTFGFLYLFHLSYVVAAQTPKAVWVGTWSASPVADPLGVGKTTSNTTYRNIVHLSVGGETLRIELTNEFGTQSLSVGDVHVALSAGKGTIEPSSDRVVTFHGSPSVNIPAGAAVLSDPVPLSVKALADLAVSVYLPQQRLHVASGHDLANATNFSVPGDATASHSLLKPSPVFGWPFLSEVDVMTREPDAAAIAVFGDSISDGWKSTWDANTRWPDLLATRLQAGSFPVRAVLNEGISGNRLLHDDAGQNALARFTRDVLSRSGVRYVVLLEGINDIGMAADPKAAEDVVTGQQLSFALEQLATRAHTHGIKVYCATLLPYQGATYYSDKGELLRQQMNDWIRGSSECDSIFDFDKVMADPSRPKALRPEYDSGDHLHPSDRGYKALADSIDPSLFR